MAHGKFLFTSEAVSMGHPDKLADQISDGILDALFAKDPYSRVACETMVTTGIAIVAGEITTKAVIDYPDVVRQVIRDVGYTDDKMGICADTCAVMLSIDRQSPDIAMGVNDDAAKGKDIGAGDQGLMFGYACNDTPELMPMPIMLAHRLAERLAEVRKNGTVKFFRPDGKSQVTVRYDDEHRVLGIDTIVVSTQHAESASHKKIKEAVMEEVIKPVVSDDLVDRKTKYFINPTGRFVVGGPMGDSGLTGRKIIVDTYGGMGRHGGGAFSGKDPSKVDRSACYYARYIAKNVVAAKLASRCEVQLAYAIGVAKPVSFLVDTFGTGVLPNDQLSKIVEANFDARPGALIAELNLRRPIFRKTAAYGHFGRADKDFTWERTNKAAALRAAVSGAKAGRKPTK